MNTLATAHVNKCVLAKAPSCSISVLIILGLSVEINLAFVF